MIGIIDIATSGLVAQRLRLDTIANNVANISTTHDEFGRPNPYRRKQVLFQEVLDEAGGGKGVKLMGVVPDFETDFRKVPDPQNPGQFILKPNVDLAVEMVDAIEATRAYDANVAVVQATRSMMGSASRLLL